MLGTDIRAMHAVRGGVPQAALRRERLFVFSRETRKAGNVRGPAVANPSHCERESPVRTKPWPSRRSVKDLRRNGNLPILSDREGQQKSLYGEGETRCVGGRVVNPAMLCQLHRRMKTVRPCCPTFSLRSGSPYADARTFFNGTFGSRCVAVRARRHVVR